MSDSIEKSFDQVAAFQKLWLDSFADMASIWSQFSPTSPPSDELRKMRGGMLKVLAETWDEYMRTPQFLQLMKASLSGMLDVKRMARDGLNRVHDQLENTSKQDVDDVLMAVRHVERRILVEDDVAGAGEAFAVVGGMLLPIAGNESASVEPDHDGTFCVVVD
jgi:translation initiation factor 2 alpha subunit (eIF-2alpha)